LHLTDRNGVARGWLGLQSEELHNCMLRQILLGQPNEGGLGCQVI